MKCFLYLLIFNLMGCDSHAELNARDWIWKISPAVPIKSIQCELEDKNGDDKVVCIVEVESVGRTFYYQLECLDKHKPIYFGDKCVEVFNG